MKNNRNFVKIIIAILIVFLIIILINFQKNKDEISKNIETEIIVKNLDTPWAIDFLPTGDMVYTERPGKVNVYYFNTKEKKIIAEIKVTEISESGLAGIAVDPEFEKNNYIYLYYTYEINDKIFNRVSRFVFDNNKLKEEIILLDNIPAARFHDGGRLKFGPDSMLYISTGDATDPSSAQDLNSVSGKILRMNKDGSVPEDNPFKNYVYSYGHRNPQGIAFNLDKNIIYAAEHGPSRRDEVNIIEISKNYGWPTTCDEPSNFKNPIKCYTEFTLAPAGIAYHKNNLYVAGLRGTQVRKLYLSDDGEKIIDEEELFSELGRIREVVVHNDYLYIATSNRDGRGLPRPGDDKIIRIKLS